MVLMKIRLDRIHDNPYQPRIIRDVSNDLRLRKSMQESGLLVPLLGRPYSGKPGEVILTDGQRRLDQARALNWTEITVDVRDLTEEQAAKASLEANDDRARFISLSAEMGLRLTGGDLKDLYSNEFAFGWFSACGLKV